MKKEPGSEKKDPLTVLAGLSFYQFFSISSVMRGGRLVLRLLGKRGEDDLQLLRDLAKFGRKDIERLLLAVDQRVKLFQLALLMRQLNFKIVHPVTHPVISATAGERIQP